MEFKIEDLSELKGLLLTACRDFEDRAPARTGGRSASDERSPIQPAPLPRKNMFGQPAQPLTSQPKGSRQNVEPTTD
jgi:hypothetical protein